MLVSVIVGLLVEGVCFKAVRSDNPLTSMVSAFAMWMVLEEIIILATWGRLFPVENPTGLATFDIGGFMVRGDYFILFVSAVLLMGLIYWLLYRTRYGRRGAGPSRPTGRPRSSWASTSHGCRARCSS